jgi:hypothetical protein
VEVLRALDFLEHSLDLPESSIVRYVGVLSDPVQSISVLLVHTVDFVLEIGKEAEALWR